MEQLPRDVLFELSRWLDPISYSKLALSNKHLYSVLHRNDFPIQSEVEGSKATWYAIVKRRNLFITGSAGTGKSYLARTIIEELKRLKRKVKAVSTTAISACNFENGSTIHSFFRISPEARSVSDHPFDIKAKKYIKTMKDLEVLLIEEVSMLDSNLLEIVNAVLKYYRDDGSPFGGVQVIFTGDFYQLPPIKGEYAFRSMIWQVLDFGNIGLPHSIRHQNDLQYYSMLQRIRVGAPSENDCQLLSMKRDRGEISNTEDDIDPLLEQLEPLRLYAVNKGAIERNQERFSELKGKSLGRYQAQDRLVSKKKVKVGEETREFFVPATSDKPLTYHRRAIDNKLHKHPDDLQFKEGAQYIITINDHKNSRLMNGSMVILKENLGNELIVITAKGTQALISPVPLRIKLENGLYYERVQYPLILGYATTIHNSQGMSLDQVFIDLDRVFAEHQVYVALSRVKTLAGLVLHHFDEKKIKVSPIVKRFYEQIKYL